MTRRPDLTQSQPAQRSGRTSPTPRRRKGKAGSFTNPYQRKDYDDKTTAVVRITARVSKDCAIAYKEHALTLKSDDGIEVNRWLEALILFGIEHGFLRGRKTSEPPPAADATADAT